MSPLKPQATYDDFARLDIRIGKVVEVQPFPRARNPSLKVGVDVGAGRIMWSSAQITNYEPAALIGSLVVCVCNLGPKRHCRFHLGTADPGRQGCRRPSHRTRPAQRGCDRRADFLTPPPITAA
ncbi:hypothetical protein ACVWY2_000902 [Bradyrhizobium sp. JR6.1]